MELFDFQSGSTPFMLSIPHAGTWIPGDISSRLTEEGLVRRDTDWFLGKLYQFPELQTASRIVSSVSRYVVDLNRAQNNESLYPGQNTTGLCPVKTFRGKPIYQDGNQPDENEIVQRVKTYWQPYHSQLSAELDRIVAEHGFAVLLDGHSIADQIDRLFDGKLPTFNFGTNKGKTCDATMQKLVEDFAAQIETYSAVVNGRFVGGYITREYGSRENVNAVQLELAQTAYMDQDELVWEDSLANQVRPVIQSFIQKLQAWIQSQ